MLLTRALFGETLGWQTGGIFTANQFSSTGPLACSTFTDFTQIATPANPAASHNRLYFKAGDHLYMLNSSGVEVQVDGGGGSGITSINGNSTAAQILAVGSAGTDFALVDSGATHTFNLPTADATHTGKLSSTDWSTFNGKQSALTFGNLTDAGTDGLTVTGGTGAVIGSGTSLSQHVADSTHNGYLSQTDWSTFNSKVSASDTANFWRLDGTNAPTADENMGGFTLFGNSTSGGSLTLSSTSDTSKGFVQINDGSYAQFQEDPAAASTFVGSTAESDYKAFVNLYSPGTPFYYGYIIPQDLNTNTGAPFWFTNLIANGAGTGGNGGAQLVMSSARATAGGDDWNHAGFVKAFDTIAAIYPSVYGLNFEATHSVGSVPAGFLGWIASEDHNDTSAGTNFNVQVVPPGTQSTTGLGYNGDGSLHLGLFTGQPENMILQPNTKVTTTDATVTTFQTIPLDDNTVTYLSAKCTGRRTDAADRGVFEEKVAMYREAGGGATIQGSINAMFEESSDATFDVTWDVSGNNAILEGNGAVGKTVNWHCITEIEKGN